MDIKSNEIHSVENIGTLHDGEVRLLRTVGGLYVAIGKKNKTSKNPECLCCGSHRALVNYQLEKEYKTGFQPKLEKSEHDKLETVEEKTNFLPQEYQDKGIKLLILSKNEDIDFIVFKHGISLAGYKTKVENDKLILKNSYFKKDLLVGSKELAKSIAMAIEDKSKELKKASDPSQYKVPNPFTKVELLNAIRQDIISENDAINLYESHKAASDNKELNEVLTHIISEEKQHIAELNKVLYKLDPEQKEKNEKHDE